MDAYAAELTVDRVDLQATFLGLPPSRPHRSRRPISKLTALRLVLERLFRATTVAWAVTFLTFSFMNLLPGNAPQALLGQSATAAQVHAMTLKLDLNHSFFERYAHWLAHALVGNLGTSLASGQTVVSIIDQRLPVSMELVLIAVVVALVVAVPAAILCARRPGGVVDNVSMAISMVGVSLAPFVLAIVLVLTFSVRLGWLPALGFTPISQSVIGNLESLTLPVCSIALPLFSVYSRVLRADLLQQMSSELYVLTAQAKGASRWRVLCRHALRNSLFGLATVVGLNVGTLLGSTVIIEQVFGIPGLGPGLLQAISDRDVPVVEAVVLIFALTVVVANLLTDIVYSVLDPRIQHGLPRR